MKELLEWERLQRSEARPSQTHSFQMCDHTQTDLRNEYAFFLSTCLQMHALIGDCFLPLPEAERQSLARQLGRIEQEAHGLGLSQRAWAG
jgi:hypothetical protein